MANMKVRDGGNKPTNATKRKGSNDPGIGAVTRSDSMNQGSFANPPCAPDQCVSGAMKQGKKPFPGTIRPGAVPRVRSSMHQG